MSRRPKLSRRLATAARWPLGIGLTSWRYMWRTTPMHRREHAGTVERDAPPLLPPGSDADDVQKPDDGVGPLFHRRYRTRIRESDISAPELFGQVSADIDRVAPTEFASFQKIRGDDGRMAVGDEYVVRMPGPWDGPVRVVEVTPTSFRLVTLEGHLEAGQIRFSVEPGELILFSIESWARSADWLVHLLYDRVRMAKETQLHMWTSVLEGVVRLSGGRMTGGVDIETRRVLELPVGAGARGQPASRSALDELHDAALNFDLSRRAEFTPAHGWHVDDCRWPLRAEPPGPPVPGGSWEVAQRLMRTYEFADRSIVRAVFRPDDPLDQRDMLLEIRFYGLRFHVGVRVGGVYDETREVHGRAVRVWGWNYRTLQGHLEKGQMDYEVWKWSDTGEVEFRIHAFSRAAEIRNPIVRLGWRLFGRRQQLRFYRRCGERMAQLTAAELENAGRTAGVNPGRREGERQDRPR
ncbi:MAG TPA: DUF1990 family protein [Solirubrobacteraceae bacterium]|nr:DUF1990 family protein [Solirubrobacteraceae bacterium]